MHPLRVTAAGVATFVCVLIASTQPPAEAAADGNRESEDPMRVATSLRDRALAENQAWDLLESLTTEVGHRFAGSDGDRRAVAWAKAKMEALGFDKVWTEPVMVPRWVRGPISGRIVAPYPQDVALIALGGSAATPEGGVEAEVVAFASLDELSAAPDAAVRGKIVFLNQRMERTRDGSGYGRTVRIRTQGAATAGPKGALAVLIRSVGTGSHRVPHTGTTRYTEDGPRIPAAALSNPDADLLAAQLGRGEPVRFHLNLASQTLPDVESANVIGEFTGHETPEEIVLLGAHLDSWDVGQGAHDDASGCAIAIEAARLIGALPGGTRRTVRVVLFANEEFGLSGARAYPTERADEIPRHVAAVEADFGAGAVWNFSSRVHPDGLDTVAAIADVLAPLGIEAGGNDARGGADLRPLRSLGVPVFSLSQDGSDYFDLHHTENDTLAMVDPEALSQNVAAHAVLAYVAAQQERPFRSKPEEDAAR